MKEIVTDQKIVVLKCTIIKDKNGFFAREEARLFTEDQTVLLGTVILRQSIKIEHKSKDLFASHHEIYVQHIDEYNFSGVKIKETISLVDQNGDELSRTLNSEHPIEGGNRLLIFDIVNIHSNTIAQEERLINVNGDVLNSEFTEN